MVVAPAAVIVASATQYSAIRQVEPQILPQVTLLTLPATRRHLNTIVQLQQVSGMPYTYSKQQSTNECKNSSTLGGNIVWLRSLTVTCQTCNSEVTQRRRFDSEPGHCRVTTLGKLFTHMCLCHQAV